MADKNKPGDYFNRPEKTGAWKGFKQFLWNPDSRQFMGRTSGSWGKHLYNLSSKKPKKKKRKKMLRDFALSTSEIYFITEYSGSSRHLAPIYSIPLNLLVNVCVYNFSLKKAC